MVDSNQHFYFTIHRKKSDPRGHFEIRKRNHEFFSVGDSKSVKFCCKCLAKMTGTRHIRLVYFFMLIWMPSANKRGKKFVPVGRSTYTKTHRHIILRLLLIPNVYKKYYIRLFIEFRFHKSPHYLFSERNGKKIKINENRWGIITFQKCVKNAAPRAV